MSVDTCALYRPLNGKAKRMLVSVLQQKFEELFTKYDNGNKGYLTLQETWHLTQANRNVMDPVGWYGSPFVARASRTLQLYPMSCILLSWPFSTLVWSPAFWVLLSAS